MTHTFKTDRDFADIWKDAMRAMHAASMNLRRAGLPPSQNYWWCNVQQSYKPHPVVQHIVDTGVRPVNWHQLLLEWPHVSDTDPSMLAYTRNEEAGRDFLTNGSKRQTRTTIGKYLARHWPHVPDHVRRDWAGMWSGHAFEIYDTMEGIISAIELGPRSCMKSSAGNIPFDSRDNAKLLAWQTNSDVAVPWHKHPYSVYDPKYGWRMAVRIDPGQPDEVMGRALLNVDSDGTKVFVRSYKRGEHESSYSEADERLEYWLQQQGYTKVSSWPDGTKLRKVTHNDQYLMPYIDGAYQNVDERDSYFVIDSDGDIEATNTDGYLPDQDDRETIGECDRCGDTVYEDDSQRIWAGRHEDVCVCGSCAQRYTWVTGATIRGRTVEYYVHEQNVLSVDGTDYDEDNLPDNIVQLANGDYGDTESGSIVYVDDEWYEYDDDAIVQCEDGKYRLRDDCWEDAEGEWHSDDEESVEHEGKLYTTAQYEELNLTEGE